MNNSTFRPSQTGNRPPSWLIGLITIIGLVLIGGSIFLYYALIILPRQSTDPHSQATATAESLASLLQMPADELYTHVTGQNPSFTDTLNGQNPAAWDLNTQNGEGCIFNNNALHIIVSSQQIFNACYVHNKTFSDFAFQVQMKMKQASTPEQTHAGGIAFRTNLTQQTAYTFEIVTHSNGILLPDTEADLVLNDANGEPHTLFSQTDPTLNDLGQPKELTVIALQNKLYTYINKKLIGSATDATFHSGALGLFVTNGGPDPLVDVIFQNAQAWVL
jgi:hypothetical protein